jgi:hypothetical protein
MTDEAQRHSCKHQTAGLLRCPVPSCPDSPRGRLYRVKVQEGKRHAHAWFQRVLGDTGWTWRPLLERHEAPKEEATP